MTAPPKGAPSFRVEDLHTLESEWNGLLEETREPNIFLTWEWISTWWSSFGTGARPWILTARDPVDDHLLGLAPLYLRSWPHPRLGILTTASLIGDREACADHLDLVAEPACTQPLADELARRLGASEDPWDVLELNALSPASVLLQTLVEPRPQSSKTVRRMPCPYIELPDTWDEYQSRLTGKFRYNLRSRARRLERDARQEVALRRISDDSEIPRAIEAVFELHGSIRQQRGDEGAFADPRMVDFHRHIARSFHRRGWLRLYLLSVGDEPIAAAYCYSYRRTVYFYQTGFDIRWSRYGPGSAIIAHAIRDSIEQGAREFDFMRGDEPYKCAWTGDVRRDYRVRLSRSFRGRLLVGALKAGGATRRELRRVAGATAGAIQSTHRRWRSDKAS